MVNHYLEEMDLDAECKLQLEVQGLREGIILLFSFFFYNYQLLLLSTLLVLKRKEKDLQSLREYNEIERQAYAEQTNELERIKQDNENMDNKLKELLLLQENINERKRIQIESLQYKSGYELLKEIFLQNLKTPNDKKLQEEAERIVAIVDM